MFKKGSEWRKWDLHLHTLSSYDYDYKREDADQLLIQALIDAEVSAVAITDHFVIDSKRINKLRELGKDKIVFFPGVELRTNLGAPNVHIILIFSNEVNLEILQKHFEVNMLAEHAKPNNPSERNDENIFWNMDDIFDFANKRDTIITIHAGEKSNGIDKEISNSSKFTRALKREYGEYVDIFEMNSIKDIEGYEKHVFKHIRKRPLIICSDNHNPNNYVSKENLWLKCDLTFEGLKQVLIDCDERVFVGEVPPKLDDSNKNPSKYIKNITINKILPSNHDNVWFNTDLDLNIGLISIIGNKGSGKSALADIIAHTCTTKNASFSSFLNSDRFRSKKNNYAKYYKSIITWKDDSKTEKESLDETKEQLYRLAQFLPQQYIENLCNNLEEDFQYEIDELIFSYIEDKDKYPSSNLNEYFTRKCQHIYEQIKDKHQKIKSITDEIIKLEDKCHRDYRKEIKIKIAHLQDELFRHDKLKPREIEKPSCEDETNQTIDELYSLISENNKKYSEYVERYKKINVIIDEVETVINSVHYFEKIKNDLTQKLGEIKSKYDIKDDFIKVSININNIKKFLLHKKKEKEDLYEYIYNQDIDELPNIISMDALKSKCKEVKNLLTKNQIIKSYIKNIKDNSSLVVKKYSNYLKNLDEWDNKRKEILGTPTQINSLKYYEEELRYIDDDLPLDLDLKHNTRINFSKAIHELFAEKVKIYEKVYLPIKNKFEKILYKIDDGFNFEANIKVNSNFDENLLSFINKTISSDFRGVEGIKFIRDEIASIDFTNIESTIKFIEKIVDSTYIDYKSKLNKLFVDRTGFNIYLFSLEYLNVEFSLKIGSKNLSELSPGERGNALLTFYLALDKNNIPLIIDQPEDNLDNQSVFNKLVPCVKEAKKHRQVILVTHNPNIAIACDSEQIIYCKINKNKNEITYESGSIENKDIRKHIVDVLEGTEPAFVLRKDKYRI